MLDSLHTNILHTLTGLETYYADRNITIVTARDLFEMAGSDRDAPSGYVNFMGNAAFTGVRLATSLLTSSRPFLTRINRSNAQGQVTDKERLSSTRVENFGYASMKEANTLAFERGHQLFDQELAQTSLVDGWYAAEVLLDPEDETTPFQVRTLDPAMCYPQYSASRREAVFYKWAILGSDAEHMFGKTFGTKKDDMVYVISCWYWESGKVHQVVFGYPQKTKKGFETVDGVPIINSIHPKLKALPILCGPIYGIHYRQSTQTSAVGATRPVSMTPMNDAKLSGKIGMSWLYGIKDIVRHYDDIMSSIALMIRKFTVPTVLVKTPSGRVVELELGTGSVNRILSNEDVQVLWVQGQPPDFNSFLREANRLMQSATLPDRGQATSGLMLGILNNITLHQLVPWRNFISQFYERSIGLQLQQFEALSKGEQNKFRQVWGRDSKDNHFFLDLTNEDIGGFYGIEANVDPIFVQDEVQRAAVAVQLTQNKLASREYVAERYLKIPDWLKERKAIAGESVETMDTILLAQALEALVAQERMVAAGVVAKKLNELTGKPVGVLEKEGAAPINPRTGLPERELLPPPQASAEAQQGSPQEPFQTAQGIPSAGQSVEDVIQQMGLV